MDAVRIHAADIAKDIVVAKLSNPSPVEVNEDTGENIAFMFDIIYNKVYNLLTASEDAQ